MRNRKEESQNYWSQRSLTWNVEFARAILSSQSYLTEMKDVFQALKSILICVSYSKQATLRQKSMKIIKALIKTDPLNMLQDVNIQLIIQLRVEDISSVTRESALDIIQKNLGNLIEINTEKFQI